MASDSRNGVHARSLFEQALDLCATSAEREKVQRLAVRLQLSENASEWVVLVLHAEGRSVFSAHSDKTLGAIIEQLGRVEATVDDLKAQKPALLDALNRMKSQQNPVASTARDMTMFAIATLCCVAIAVASMGNRLAPTFISFTAFLGLGVLATLAYLWLAPIVGEAWAERRQSK